MKCRMILSVMVFSIFGLSLNAQVTIGMGEAPTEGALLQLKEKEVNDDSPNATKGLEFPRVELTDENNLYPMFDMLSGLNSDYLLNKTTLDKTHLGLVVYNTSAVSPFQRGLYLWDGTRWTPVGGSPAAISWFYMPSIAFATDADKTGETKELYDLYKAQFGTPKFKSDGAPASIPYIPDAGQLYYYVTDADPAVFQNISIDDKGKMTYDVKAATTETSYINIVFVIK